MIIVMKHSATRRRYRLRRQPGRDVRLQGAPLAGHRAHDHRRGRRRPAAREPQLRAAARRRAGRAHPAAVQARQPRLPPGEHRSSRCAACPSAGRSSSIDRRAVLGGEPQPAPGDRAGGEGGRRRHPARRRVQAAHLALLVPGPGRGRAGAAGRGARGDRPADHHRGHVPGSGAAGRQVRRRPADRRAQHAELPAAAGGGHARARPSC